MRLKKLNNRYFKGKNAIITGAASGIGRAFAIELAKMGTNLLVSDINMDRLEQVKEETEAFGVKVYSMNCNVIRQKEVNLMAERAISEMGEIHFVFSNAGIAMGGPFEYLTISQWKTIVNINLWGTIYVIKAFIPKLLEQGAGHIISTSSICGSMGIGGLTPYSTVKFANAGFCEALYGEYKSNGINISIICPFPIKTNLIETVGIGIPPELLDELDPATAAIAIQKGKDLYWEKFTAKGSGFFGGFELDRAIKRYIKKISKKKLYIFERRYGRFLQFVQGMWPALYKKILKKLGKHHMDLIWEVLEFGSDAAEEVMEKEVKK